VRYGMDGERCETCRFFDQHRAQDFDDMGHCRRYAPRPTINPPRHKDGELVETIFVNWPETSVGDWCGEWRAKIDTTQTGNLPRA
jgi:hypothetical protein